MPNVSNIVKTIQDIMRKDAGTYGDAQRLEQLGWMLFLKIFDDREKELDILRENYTSRLPKNLRWTNWASNEEGITGDELLDFVNITLLPKLKALTGGRQNCWLDPNDLRGCQQLHEERHPHAAGYQ
jgi:type I restriction enzyme M protein